MFAGNHGFQYFFIMAILAANTSIFPEKWFKSTKVIINIIAMFLMSYIFFKLFWEINTLPLPVSNIDIQHALGGIILGCALSHYHVDSKLWRMKNPLCREYMAKKIF